MRSVKSFLALAGSGALMMALSACDKAPDSPVKQEMKEEPAALPSTPAPDVAIPAVATPIPATTDNPEETAKLRTFKGRDLNHDGVISPEEDAAVERLIFVAIDADQNGLVTGAELDNARLALELPLQPESSKLIAQVDQDNDGRLTLAEWIAHESRTFKQADTNEDGVLSNEEWEAAAATKTSVLRKPVKP